MPFSLTPNAIVPTANTWTTLASGLPSTSGGSAVVGAIVRVVASTTGYRTLGFRMTGSTDTLQAPMGSSASAWVQEYYIGCNSSQQIDVFLNVLANVTVYVIGGFTAAEAVFFTNVKTQSAAGSSGFAANTLLAADYGSDTPQAVIILPTTSTAAVKGARQTGSADTWMFCSNGVPLGLIIGVENNAGIFQFDWYRATAAATINLVGYIKTNLVWTTNAAVVTPGSTGSYVDITSGGLPPGTVAALYGLQGTAANEQIAVAASTTPSPDLYGIQNTDHLGLQIGFCDGSRKVYGKISAGTAAIRIMGYFTGGAGAVPTVSSLSSSAYLSPTVINGTGFTSGQMTVTMGGVTQTLGTVTSTTIAIASLTRNDGTNQCGYGTQEVLVTNSATGTSAAFPINFTPQTGGQYVVLGTIDPTAAYRITGIPDYTAAMQLAAYGATGSGSFTLYPDASFEWDPTITGFYVEAFNGTSWGAVGFETLIARTPGGGGSGFQIVGVLNGGFRDLAGGFRS